MAERDQLFQEEYRSRRKPLSTAFFPNISLLAYLVREIKAAPLVYRSEKLLAHHLEKHLNEFEGLPGAEAYEREARHVVRGSERILAHIENPGAYRKRR